MAQNSNQNTNTGLTGNVKIPGPLHDTSDYNIVAYAGDIYDDSLAANQTFLNAYFKDVSPERDGTKGKKYVILRSGSSLQSQMQTGGIYEIRDDFNLENGTLNVPSGSVLYFKGGSISNGTIALNNAIVYPYYNHLGNLTITGNPSVGTEKIDTNNIKCYWNGEAWISAETLISNSATSITEYVDTEIAKLAPVEHTFSASFVSGKKYQRLFSLPTNCYAIVAVSVTVMGKSWSDILYYSNTLNRDRYYFYTNSHQFFYESRAGVANPLSVCMPNKQAPMAPSTVVKMQVIKSSGTVTWYDEEPQYEAERQYDVLNSRIVAEELDFSLSTYCETNSNGELVSVAGESVTIQDNELYTVNASASSGNFTLPTRNYHNVNIYCFGDGVATLGEETLQYSDGDIINIEGTHMSIESNPKEYYTKDEIDVMLSNFSPSVSGGMSYKGTSSSLPGQSESGDVYIMTNSFQIGNTLYQGGTAVVYDGSTWKALSPSGLESISNKAIEINSINTDNVHYPTTGALVEYAEKKKLFSYKSYSYQNGSVGFVAVFKELDSNVTNFVKNPSKLGFATNPLLSNTNYGYYKQITSDLCYASIAVFKATAGTQTIKCWFDNDVDNAFFVEVIEDTNHYCYVIKDDYCPDVIITGSDPFEVYLKLVGKSGHTLHTQFIEIVSNNSSNNNPSYWNKFAARVVNTNPEVQADIVISFEFSNTMAYPLELTSTNIKPAETGLDHGYGYNLIRFDMLHEFCSSVEACDDTSFITIEEVNGPYVGSVSKGDELFAPALAAYALDEDEFTYINKEYEIKNPSIYYKYDFVDMWIHASQSSLSVSNNDIDEMWDN